ncbi:MAG: WbqC family protein [Elusimicrobia bacterium]|nr:WbqC family protein [Elusimicrobiota bacterium]
MRTVAIHQPECFPWLGFLDKARQSDVFIILDSVQYEKNYFQNRNKIRTADGWTWLTIPVETSGKLEQTIAQARISDAALPRWREKHLAAWRQNYGKTADAEACLGFLEAHYAKRHQLLADFNTDVIRWLFERFGIKAELRRSSQMAAKGRSSALLASLCKEAGAEAYLSGVSGKDYLDEAEFSQLGLQVRYQEFHHPIYKQSREPFISCLSSFDLLFNYGAGAPTLLFDPATPRLTEVFT